MLAHTRQRRRAVQLSIPQVAANSLSSKNFFAPPCKKFRRSATPWLRCEFERLVAMNGHDKPKEKSAHAPRIARCSRHGLRRRPARPGRSRRTSRQIHRAMSQRIILCLVRNGIHRNVLEDECHKHVRQHWPKHLPFSVQQQDEAHVFVRVVRWRRPRLLPSRWCPVQLADRVEDHSELRVSLHDITLLS